MEKMESNQRYANIVSFLYVNKMSTEKQKTIWKRNKHPMLGKHHSNRGKKNISNAKKGKLNFKLRDIIKKLGLNKGIKNPNYGKITSEETKEKIRKTKIGKDFMTKEQRNIVNKKIKGKKRTIEQRKRISNGLKGKLKTEEHKKKMSMAHIKYMQNNPEKCKMFNTSIEIKIQNFLKELKIEYFTHQYMKIEHGYQCDILIPSMNLVIECDGDYWHKYPIGLERDHIRTKELLEKGFKVLRLWECEIRNMNLNEFKRRL